LLITKEFDVHIALTVDDDCGRCELFVICISILKKMG